MVKYSKTNKVNFHRRRRNMNPRSTRRPSRRPSRRPLRQPLRHRYSLRNITPHWGAVMNVGQYKGKTLLYIYNHHKSYLDWVKIQISFPNNFSDAIVEGIREIYSYHRT